MARVKRSEAEAGEIEIEIKIGSNPKLCDTQVEQILLGLMLVEPRETIPQLLELGVRPEHFFWRKHRVLYRLLLEMHEEGREIDLATAHGELVERAAKEKDNKDAENLWGLSASYLSELAAKATLPERVPAYVRILLNRWRRRQLWELAHHVQDLAMNGFEDEEGRRRVMEVLEGFMRTEEALHSETALIRPKIEAQRYEELPMEQRCEWLVQDLLPWPRVVGLGGKRASFKTFLALHIGLCVATGTPVFGKYPVLRPGTVCFLNEENPPDVIGSRARSMAPSLRIPPGPEGLGEFWTTHFQGWNLRDEESFERLRAFIRDKEPVLLIVDSLARIWGVQDEIRNMEIAQAMQRLRDLTEEFGITVLFLHHLRKTTGYGEEAGDFLEALRGGSEIVNLADSVFVLQRKRGEPVVIVKHGKNRDGQELKPFRLRMEALDEGEGTKVSWIWEGEITEAEEKLEACMNEILDWFNEQPSSYEARTKEIVNIFGEKYSERTVKRALKALLEGGELIQPLKGRYALPESGLFSDDEGKNDIEGEDF